ncbi:MAG: response regulator [Psychroserpens sp.]|nr:response regulator [Psychroserpens sp.]
MSHLEIIQDVNNEFTPEIILTDSTLKFAKRASFGRYLKPNSTYWGKLIVKSTDAVTDWTLQLEDRHVGPPAWTKSNGKVDVYAFLDDKLLFHKKTGVGYSRSERELKSNWVLNKVSLSEIPEDQATTLLIKVSGNQLGYPPFFNLTIRSPKQPFYHQIFQIHNSFNIFMFGVTFIIFLYHILQFFYLRQKVFLWFSIWVMFCMLTHAMTIGLIIGSTTIFRFGLWSLIANGIFYMFWFFGRSFIDSKRKYPILDKFILGLSGLLILEIIATTIYVYVFNAKPVILSIGIHNYVLAFYTICSLVLSIVIISKKDVFAKYFGFGSIIASICLIIGNLWSMGIIDLSKNFADPYAIGMFLQIIIYSFGIAYRQQQIAIRAQNDKLEAQKNYAEMQRVKDLDEVKTRFFANISHEFRTPLSLIAGPVNRAYHSRSADQNITLTSKHFEIIKKNTNRLVNLVDQLLDLSKLESGKIHLSLKQGEIIKFLRSIVNSFESVAERENISLNTNFPSEKDNAFFDKDKLEKIVTNLLSNAFKYTSENGSVNVVIDHDSKYLSVEISDTGKGIDKEDVKKIFERFYRVEGSEEKGSGIGLALTKELIDLHKGMISVSSTKGIGTTFKVRLPISMDLLPESICFIENDNIKEEVVHSRQVFETDLEVQNKIKGNQSDNVPVVLIVEDNKDLQEYIGDVLKNNYSLLYAKDGLQGERMAFEHIPDIVISDVMMPKKDGYALCSELKTNAKTSHIPIVMLTAKAGQSSKMEGLTQGADAYLTKPFNDKELLLTLRNLVNSHRNQWEHFKALDMLLVNDIEMTSIDDRFLQDVFKLIKDNLDNENFGVEDIAGSIGFSRSQLHRKLKALTNKSANQLITEIRLNEAKRMLQHKVGSVSEIAYSVGYSNLSYFTKSFKEKFGILPSRVE